MDWLEWLSENAWAAWLATALVLAAIEAATADFVFLMLAGGALAGAAAALAFPAGAQVGAAVVVAIGLLLLVRPVVRRKVLESTPDQPPGVERYFGQPGVVIETVSERDGRVKIDGEVWSARYEEPALPAGPGSAVHIIGVDGVTFLVRPVETVQDSGHSAPDLGQ